MRVLLIVISLITLASSCKRTTERKSQVHIVKKDLSEIRNRGKIVAITDFNSTSYFIYRGEAMGFQFELLQEFANYLNLDLEIITLNDLHTSFDMLNGGDADIMALNLTINKERKELVKFTAPIGQTRQVLVQRRPDKWMSLSMSKLNQSMIRNQLDLAGKTIYVQSGSSFLQRLKNLQDEIGDSINIIEVSQNVEKLISLVANKEIDYTVCDENVGRVNRTYYKNLDVETPISFPQNLAWAVRKVSSDELLSSLNDWIKNFKRTTAYNQLYAKYFKNSRSKTMVQSDSYSLISGQVSQYDKIFKQYSDTLDWDWRLLASLVAQESRFNPDVRSWAGAYGLMQLMPTTGKSYGIDITSSPEENIRAGIRYILWLQELFEDKVKDENERLKFILAAYNVGAGHVIDARKLALKNDKSDEIWDDNVEYYLLKKSEPAFYHDPIVEHGFCRGEEPTKYVREVLARYENYMNLIAQNSSIRKPGF